MINTSIDTLDLVWIFDSLTVLPVQLLDNILLWGSILSTPCLKDLALDSTLNRYILSALQTTETAEENIQKCQKVANKLTRHATERWPAYPCQKLAK